MIKNNIIFIILFFFLNNLIAQTKFTGIIKPVSDIELSISMDGPISNIYTKEGSFVKKNDKILKINDKLQTLETKRRLIILNDKSKVVTLKNEEKILSGLLQTLKKLYSQNGAVSNDEVQTMKIKYFSTLGELNTAIENEKKEQLEYEISKESLEKYILRSPINGIVTEIKIDVGEWARISETIVRIVDSSTCILNLNIRQNLIPNIRKSQIVNINLDISDEIVNKKGKITFISPIADQSSGLVLVKVEFDNKDLKILPGITAEVELINDNRTDK